MLPYIWRDLHGSDLGYGLWFVEFCTLNLIGNSCSGASQSEFVKILDIHQPTRESQSSACT